MAFKTAFRRWDFLKVLRYFFSWFTTLRFYNLLLLVFTLLTLFCRLKQIDSWWEVLMDVAFIGIVSASFFSVSAGYVINDFYDKETDLINHPWYVKSQKQVAQKHKFQYYFFANFLSVGFAASVSLKIGLFFAGFVFWIWFYSHKVKRYPLLSLFVGALLPTIPMLAMLMYLHNTDLWVMMEAYLMYLLLLAMGLVKSLVDLKGDLYCRKSTLATQKGIRWVKKVLFLLFSLIALSCGLTMLWNVPLGFRVFVGLLLVASVCISLFLMRKTSFFAAMYLGIKCLVFLGVVLIWWR